MITLTDDYNQKNCIPITNYKRSLLGLKTFSNLKDETYLIDVKQLRLKKKEVEWIINNSWKDVVIIDEDLAKYTKLPDYVVVNQIKEDISILDYMRLISYERDRTKVYNILIEHKPPVFVLYNWLLNNVTKIKCIDVLFYIDLFVLAKQKDSMFYSMVAFGIKPLTKGSIDFKYKTKKRSE